MFAMNCSSNKNKKRKPVTICISWSMSCSDFQNRRNDYCMYFCIHQESMHIYVIFIIEMWMHVICERCVLNNDRNRDEL